MLLRKDRLSRGDAEGAERSERDVSNCLDKLRPLAILAATL